MIQLTLTLKMTTAQDVETSVTVNNNSPIQDYVHPDDQSQPTFWNDSWVQTFHHCKKYTSTILQPAIRRFCLPTEDILNSGALDARSGTPWIRKFGYLCIQFCFWQNRPFLHTSLPHVSGMWNVLMYITKHIQIVFNLILEIHVMINWHLSK